MNPQKLPRKIINALNRMDGWCSVGNYIENVNEDVPDLIVDSLVSVDTRSFAIEIANRLNHYPALQKEVEELRKANLRLMIERDTLNMKLNPTQVKIG